MPIQTSQASTENDKQNLTVQDFLGGEFTSDHTWQSVEAWLEESIGEKKFQRVGEPVRLTTWNMLNQCYSRETNPFEGDFANNPFDLHEHKPVYVARKMAQIDELVKIIDTVQSDFLLLQECDWVTDNDLLEKYSKALNDKGYDLIISPKSEPGQQTQKLLVTVYNKNKFEAVAGSGKGVFATRKESQNSNSLETYCGYSIDFKNKQSQQVVSVVNLHLDFTHNYEQEITEFLKAQTAANKFTIMGGDTNHALCQGNNAMIGDYDYPTYIGFAGDLTPTPKLNAATIKGISITDEISVQQVPATAKKRYDGFFACPNQTTRVVAQELEGRYFKLEDGKLSVEKLDPQTMYRREYPIIHHSKIGRPFLESVIKLPAKSFISGVIRPLYKMNHQILTTTSSVSSLNSSVNRMTPPLSTATTVKMYGEGEPTQHVNFKKRNPPAGLKILLTVSITLFAMMTTLGLLASFNIIAIPFLPFAIAAAACALVAGLTGAYVRYKAQLSRKQWYQYQKLASSSQVNPGLADLGGHVSHQQPGTTLELESTSVGGKLFKSDNDANPTNAAQSANNNQLQ